MDELRRVLHPQGSFYLNIGDIYFGHKGFFRNKGQYARKTDQHYKEHKIVRQDGRYLQHKQLLMLLVKSPKYYFDLDTAKKYNHHRDVIKNRTEPFRDHQASYPLSLIKPFVLTTSKENDIVLDPFMGSGTTATAAVETGRRYIGFELNQKLLVNQSEERVKHTKQRYLLFN